jgi:hypothetical protein
VRLQDGLTFLSIDGKDVPLFTITEVLGTPKPDAEAPIGEGDTTTDETTETSDDSQDAA